MSDIEHLINSIADQNFADAGPTFSELLSQKMGDALEQQKVAMADQVFNGVEQSDDDISDEDLEDAVQSTLDDEDIEGYPV